MALADNARVSVSDQSSQYRNELGTVISSDASWVYVRMDGGVAGSTVQFKEAQLRSTTQPCPITY